MTGAYPSASPSSPSPVRVFTCLVTHIGSTVPILSFILAADEIRARELARRELLETSGAVSAEVYENGALLDLEQG